MANTIDKIKIGDTTYSITPPQDADITVKSITSTGTATASNQIITSQKNATVLGTDSNGQLKDTTSAIDAELSTIYETNIDTPSFILPLTDEAFIEYGYAVNDSASLANGGISYNHLLNAGTIKASTPFDLDPMIAHAWWPYFIKYDYSVFDKLGIGEPMDYDWERKTDTHKWYQNAPTILARVIFPNNFKVNCQVSSLDAEGKDLGASNEFWLYCHAMHHTTENANANIYFGSAIVSESQTPFRRYEISYSGGLPTIAQQASHCESIVKIRLIDYSENLSEYAGVDYRTLKAANSVASDMITSAVSSRVKTVKVGSTSYTPSSGTVSLPAYPSYSIATSSTTGLVKSSTTGTTSNRDYKVQVNSDGTMKVNVPWTNTDTNTVVYFGAANHKSFSSNSSNANLKIGDLNGGTYGTLYTIWCTETKDHGEIWVENSYSGVVGTDSTSCYADASGDDGYWGKSILCITVMVPASTTYYLWGRYVNKCYGHYWSLTVKN